MIKPVTTKEEAEELLNRTRFNKILSKHILDNINIDFLTRMATERKSVTERIYGCANVSYPQIAAASDKELSVALLVSNFSEWWSVKDHIPDLGRFSYRDLVSAIIKGQKTYLKFVLFEKEIDVTVKRTIIL